VLDQIRGGRCLDHFDVDGGIAREEGAQPWHDIALGESVRCADAQPSGRLLVRRLRLVARACEIVEQPAAVAVERGARLGRAHAARRALEQAHAHAVLERAHGFAD
jgi:hypothetical protein